MGANSIPWLRFTNWAGLIGWNDIGWVEVVTFVKTISSMLTLAVSRLTEKWWNDSITSLICRFILFHNSCRRRLWFHPSSPVRGSPSSFHRWIRPTSSDLGIIYVKMQLLTLSVSIEQLECRQEEKNLLHLRLPLNPFLPLIGFPSIRSFIMASMHVKEGEMSWGVLMQGGDRRSIGLWNGQSGGEAVGCPLGVLRGNISCVGVSVSLKGP